MRKPPNRERGTQIVELALILPLLGFIIFAIIDGADLVRTHLLINNAAREGARISASLYCPTCSASAVAPTVKAQVLQYISSETNGEGIGTSSGKDAWCSATALDTSNISVNPNVPYSYPDPSNPGGTTTGTATQVTIDYTYTFCYVPNFASWFGVLSNTVPLHAEAMFYNLHP